uniref:RRM domain-containing protein n=1 Tax=Plectus sambesii TaxID=2011161 RepID=A0A914VC96_9BILA
MDASNDYSTTGNGRIVNQASKPVRDSQPSPKGLSHVPANGPTMGDDPASTEDDHAIDTGAEEEDRMAPQKVEAPQEPAAPEAPVEPEPPAVPSGPMTWANRVARPSAPTKTAPAAATTNAVPVQREAAAQQQRPAPPSAAATAAVPQQHGSSAEPRQQERQEPTDPACKLYLGSILRTLSPKNPQDCEAEIKKVFEQFGPVYSVRVPRKAIDDSMHDDNGRLAAGFAFVVMETKEGAEKAYAACARDEKNRNMLNVNLPSFGFNGPAALSQQDVDRRGGGGQSQRGGYNAGQGGGRPGGSFGGGASQNQYMGGGGGPRGGRGGGMQSGGGVYRGGSTGASNSQRGGGAPPQYNRTRPPRNLQ